MRCRRDGFTLIELLVVIAIIAVLAALLFPIYEKGKEKAITTKCQAHQKELMAALLMYTHDYGGRLPFIQFLSYTDWAGTAAGRPDLHVVRLYEPYVKNTEIIYCPAKMGFAYNQCLYKPAPARLTDNNYRMQIAYDSSSKDRAGRLLSLVVRPGRTPAFFCAKRMSGKKGMRDTPGDWEDNGWGWVPSDIHVPAYFPNYHGNGANYAFLDGHVRWYPPAGNGYSMPINGIDYDGNGTIGDTRTMR